MVTCCSEALTTKCHVAESECYFQEQPEESIHISETQVGKWIRHRSTTQLKPPLFGEMMMNFLWSIPLSPPRTLSSNLFYFFKIQVPFCLSLWFLMSMFLSPSAVHHELLEGITPDVSLCISHSACALVHTKPRGCSGVRLTVLGWPLPPLFSASCFCVFYW